MTWLCPTKTTGIINNDGVFKWLKECGLKIETEALITTAQH